MKKCRNCKETFEPVNKIQPYCFQCTILKAKEKVNKQYEKEWRQRKGKLKENTKTVSDYRNEARYWFQRYIRLRDVGKKCISCNYLLTDIKTFDAGHYYSASGYPQLLFNEYNVNGQCKMKCNNMMSGNLIEYRKGLIKRHGVEVLEQLDELAEDKSCRTLSKDYYIEIAVIYKGKCKDIERDK